VEKWCFIRLGEAWLFNTILIGIDAIQRNLCESQEYHKSETGLLLVVIYKFEDGNHFIVHQEIQHMRTLILTCTLHTFPFLFLWVTTTKGEFAEDATIGRTAMPLKI
jgi:hypothetical protein